MSENIIETLSFQSGHGTIFTSTIDFSTGSGTLNCEKIVFDYEDAKLPSTKQPVSTGIYSSAIESYSIQ